MVRVNRLVLNVVKNGRNRIEFDCDISGDWDKYFTQNKFWVEYEEDITSVPESILIIPIFGTILPLSWVFDAEVCCKEIDEDFYNAIHAFKKGYADMYPEIELKGDVKIENIVKNSILSEGKTAAMFSGGADAFCTLISHIDENPLLMTVWGADVGVDNEKAWNVVNKHRQSVLEEWKLDGTAVKSSLRNFINESEINRNIIPKAGDNWWHGFHHSIGMFCLMAPICYLLRIKKIYVASSFTEKDKGRVKCASDPTIDNHVEFCGCKVFHDGYEMDRPQKIARICNYAEKTQRVIPLRVCWESKDGSNCCNCEKCFRTILGIYSENKNPHDFGFEYDSKMLKKMSDDAKKGDQHFFGRRKELYLKMASNLRENCSKKSIPKELMWIYRNQIFLFEWRYKIRLLLRKIKHTILK